MNDIEAESCVFTVNHFIMNKNIHQITIPFSEIKFSKEKIREQQQLHQHKQYFSNIIEDIYSEIKKICTINAGYQTLEISEIKKNKLHVKNVTFNISNNISLHLKNAEKIMAFMVTLGNEFDQYNKNTLSNDALNGLICDAIGSEIIENAVDNLTSQHQKTINAEKLKTTNRFSPGYCLWDVSEQHKLFSLFPHNFLNITLNQSALMKPLKTISGIIGIGKNVQNLEYNCKKCNQKNCHKWKTNY